MLVDESIQDYHLNIIDIANSFESLGEKISDEKLVRKILRSLPKKFDMKVTSIEEAQNISSLKVNELIGSLQNFEIIFHSKADKMGKSIAFASSKDSNEIQGNHEDDEDMSESLHFLGDSSRSFTNGFIEGPGQMVRTSDLTLIINQIKRKWQDPMKITLNTKVSNVMNVKDMAISELNVLLF